MYVGPWENTVAAAVVAVAAVVVDVAVRVVVVEVAFLEYR